MSPVDANERHIADRYVLRAPLGHGGMGSVWLADDTVLRREVAIKEIEFPAGLSSHEIHALRARAMREARAAAGLSSPAVVTIYDVIQEEDHGYIVMEFVRAPTLAQIVEAEGPLSPDRVAGIGLDILTALQAAHEKGIIHRDVKPANVMIPEGARAKLADFGIASVKDDPKITVTGIVLGSPQFMAPEQAGGSATGPKTDLWALGATLYFAVEGDLPFDRGGTIPTLAAVVHDPPRPMARAGPLERTIKALLEKDPDDRPDTKALRGALERAAGAAPVQVIDERAEPAVIEPRPVAPRHVPSRPRRRLAIGPIVALLLLLVIAGAAIGFLVTRDEEGGPGPRADRSLQRDAGEGGGEDESGEGNATVPASWVTYEDPAGGFTIEHPLNWDIEPSGDTQIDISHPRNGTYIRVAWTSSPGPSAVDAWEAQSASFGASHENYEEIQITPTGFKGSDNAAIWEFTYSEGGADLHAVDLGFVLDGYGYALNFQTHADNWTSSQDLFEAFKASFRP
jgi:eukaryotic-like serine/threonine-protein kinase